MEKNINFCCLQMTCQCNKSDQMYCIHFEPTKIKYKVCKYYEPDQWCKCKTAIINRMEKIREDLFPSKDN